MLGCTAPSQNENSGQATAVFVVELPGKPLAMREASVEKGTNALDAMRTVFDVETQSSSMGEFVTAIEGVEAGATEYWMLEVNGEYADKGIGAYTIDEATSFKWSLQSFG